MCWYFRNFDFEAQPQHFNSSPLRPMPHPSSNLLDKPRQTQPSLFTHLPRYAIQDRGIVLLDGSTGYFPAAWVRVFF
jgi:hypothetical protein